MKTSPSGIDRIRAREGERLAAYLDTQGIVTIGVGHVDSTLKLGQRISKEQSAALLAQDLGKFEEAINAAVHVPLNQNQFDALVSLAFNIGASAFRNSTLVKKLNTKDYAGAADQFMVWTKQKELITRRQGEQDQFVGMPS